MTRLYDADTTPDDRVATQLYGSDATPEEQRRAFVNGDVPVAVYGLGKMGLPVAAVLADLTGNVVGADIDPEVVAAVNQGECHVVCEPGLPELVSEQVPAGALQAVADPQAAADGAAVHIIVVPTLLTEENDVDLSMVEACLDDIATGLDPGDAVFVESTIPPGTCSEQIVPRLAEESGLDPEEFGVAFCPERTRSGRALRDIREAHPKIVGGVDAESTRVAELVYDEVTANEVIPVRDATTAEATKVFGGVYRDVNIALANEFARYAETLGIDVREAIEASNSQPHSRILSPGPGVGGHCIPVYPHFLLGRFDVESPLIRLARTVNDSMPAYTVDRLRRELGETGVDLRDATVLVLGLTYRSGVAETRNSPAIGVTERLSQLGATVYGCDPLVDDYGPFAATPIAVADAASLSPDAVIVVSPHEEFTSMDWGTMDPTVVVDCHDALDLEETPHREYSIGRAQESEGTSDTA